MKLKTFLASALILTLSVSIFAAPVQAIEVPNFPLCTTPQGELIVSYDSGIHGIPGDSATHTGSDKVFQVTDITLVQCFCDANGQGIQTNWWKKNSLTEDQIDTITKLGWIYIPNGSLWGLANTSYFAQNVTYSCSTTSSTNGSSSSTGGNSSSGTGGGGEVLGQVLGAATGNIVTIYLLILSGFAFFLLFLFWKKPKNANHN